MTAEEKIALSEYNLKKMKKQGFDTNFIFELSNFLSSVQSISWHLLYDFAGVFSLEMDEKLNYHIFEKLAKKQKNEKALIFIDWYNGEFHKINNEGFEFLVKRRHADVHQQTGRFFLEATITTENTATTKCFSPVGNGRYVTGAGLHYSFPEKPNDDPIVWCEKYLERIKKMVTDSAAKK